MERLTERSQNGTAVYRYPTSGPEGWKENRHAVLERCCQYEDTGLTPEEIKDGKLLTGWIPVEERMPASNERVLMYRPCMVGAETGPISVQWGWAYKDASHWMPVPCAPED